MNNHEPKSTDDLTLRKFKRFLEKKDDEGNTKNIKQDLKILLYNHKKLPEKMRQEISNLATQLGTNSNLN